MSDQRRCRLSEALRWAVSGAMDPGMSAADWLAADIDPHRPTAVSLLTDQATPLRHLQQAKDAYKTLRIVGETSAQRAVGARLYAAAIAAALVSHGRRISSQSDTALRRAFQRLLDDDRMPSPLRGLGGQALCILQQQQQDGHARAQRGGSGSRHPAVPRRGGQGRPVQSLEKASDGAAGGSGEG